MPELLVEPPGPHLPPRAGLIKAQVDLLRVAAALAAVVLALTSRGDVIVLAAALAVAAWRPSSVAVVAAAAVASAWRWGSTSLEALAGAQAVLGPAGWVGPGRAAASAWLAATALVLATPAAPRLAAPGGASAWRGKPTRRGWGAAMPWETILVAVAFGASAADVVAGPAAGGDLWIRAVATLVASAAGAAVLTLRRSTLAGASPAARRSGLALDGAGLLAACGAVVLLVGVAPGWSGALDGAALRSGAVVAVAVAMLAAVGGMTVGVMGRRQA